MIDRKLSLNLSDPALDFLAEVEYAPVYGASPLKPAIQGELSQMLTGESVQIEARTQVLGLFTSL